MKTWLPTMLVILALANLSGCTLCCAPFLEEYVTTGGKHPRSDMTHGRVGSVFSDPEYLSTESGPVIPVPPEVQVQELTPVPQGLEWQGDQ